MGVYMMKVWLGVSFNNWGGWCNAFVIIGDGDEFLLRIWGRGGSGEMAVKATLRVYGSGDLGWYLVGVLFLPSKGLWTSQRGGEVDKVWWLEWVWHQGEGEEGLEYIPWSVLIVILLVLMWLLEGLHGGREEQHENVVFVPNWAHIFAITSNYTTS